MESDNATEVAVDPSEDSSDCEEGDLLVPECYNEPEYDLSVG